MKKYLLSLLLLSFLCICNSNLLSQVSFYGFTETTEVYAQITGTTSTAIGDDGTQTNVPIGFNFNFGGVDYSAVGISTNGVIRLGSSAANTAISSGWTNVLSLTSTNRPLIAPFWDDNHLNTGSIVYATTGTAPNRVFTINYRNFRVGGGGSTAGAAVSMLVRLIETSNIIEMVYSSPFTTTNTVTASVGLNDLTSFLSVTPANPSTFSNSVANNSINSAAMSNLAGKKLIFTPQAPPTCGVPSALAATAITTTGATLNWSAPSPAPSSGYQWEVRTSGAAGSGATGLVANGSTGAGVTTAAVTGLQPATNYTAYVRSNCGGGDFSPWTAGTSFQSACIPVTSMLEDFENAAFPPSCWSLTLAGTTSWLWTNLTSGFGVGTASIIANFYGIQSPAPFEIITPPFNITNARLSFDHAYATYGTEVDKLKIFYSTDGGSTYIELIELNGGLTGPLNTAGATLSSFVPNASQWASKFYDLPAGANMVKFQAISAWGNNLFIDNIKINQPFPIDLKFLSLAQASGFNPSAPLLNPTPNGKSDMQLPQFLALDPNESGTASSAIGQTELFQNDNTRSPQQLNAIDLNFSVDNIGLNASAYTLNWTVGGITQSPYVGSTVAPGAQASGQLNYSPSERGTFLASGTLNAPGDGDLTNNSNQARVRVYPNQFARTTYDNGTNIFTGFFGYNNPAIAMIAAVRFTTPNNFTKLAGVDFFARTETVNTGTFTVEVRAAGTTTTAPGPVFYTKNYTNSVFFSASGDILHFAFDDDFPSLGPNSDYWITITCPLGVLYPGGIQAITTGRSFISSTGATWTALSSGGTNYAWMMRSVHVEGTPHPPCAVPAQPTGLALTPQTTSIGGTFTSASGTTGHIVVRTTTPSLSESPQNGTVYNTTTNSTIGNGTVVFVSNVTTTFSSSGLTHGTTYYYHVFPFNTGLFCSGPVYNVTNPLSGTATTRPNAPATFAAIPLGPNQIGFNATANSLGHNIMIAWSTESSTAFGTPSAVHPIGSTILGGGVVLYIGPASEVNNHSNLVANTTYHYRAWTIIPGPIYSTSSVLSTVTTPCLPINTLPWQEGFEGVDLGAATTSPTLFPSCWTKQNGDWATTKNSSSTNDADARTGDQFLRNSWSATNEFMWTPGFALQAGTSYDFSFWWAGDNLSGWTAEVFYNTLPNSTGATQLGDPFVTNAVVTTKNYAKVTRSFVPSESGAYYFAIRVNCPTSAPWYLSFDDFELRVTPTAPIFVVTPQQADFGSQSIFAPSSPQSITFYNDGIGSVSVNSIALTGVNASDFTLYQSNTLPILLGPGQAATVSITFTPSTAGAKTANLSFTHDLNTRAVMSVSLSGTGIDPTITTFPYVESFDGTQFAPVGWSNIRTAGTGTPGTWDRVTTGSSPTTSPKSGPAMARFNSFNFASGTKAELATPPINFPAGNYRVSFWMNRDAGYPNNTDLVNVYFNTSNSLEDAVLLGTVHRSMTLEPVVTTEGWHAYSFFLPAEATGNGRFIIFEAVSAYGNNIFIDDFSISTPMVVSHAATNLSCFGSNDGSIELSIEGGIPPISVLWIKDGEILESTSTLLEQLSAGAYEYTVKEATGIAITNVVTITQPAAIASPTVTNTTVVYDGLVKTINAVAPAGSTLVWYEQAEGGTAVPAPAKSNAGIYNYWVAAKSDATGCESPRVAAVLTISKKALTVKADDLSKCQNTDLPTLTLTYTGFVANEGPAQLIELPVATTTAMPNSPIGSYPITVSGGVSNNYSFIYQNGTLTVVRTPMVFAGGPGFVCVSEVFPIVAATATNFTSIVWTTSGNGTFSNANSINPVYTPGSVDIANGSVVLTLTADPGSFCSSVDQLVLSIQNDLPVSVTITQNDTEICIGELVTFNAIPVNGGIAPVFQWKVNGQNAGTNSNLFTYLPSNGDVVTVVLTTSISCALNTTATSNAITVTVTPDLVAGVSINTPSTAVCDFTPTTFTASPVNGGTNPIYQWKVNGVNAGTNSPQFTFVPVNGDEVGVMMTSSHSCAVVPVANSNVITMSVAPPFLELVANPTKGGTVSGGGNYANGTEVTITATAAAGWEFLNWRNLDGVIVSTEAIATYTINKCYDKLTATFSSTAKIAGQLRYFNENETIIPSPNNRSVFYVQIFENGQPLTPRQMVAYSLEMGLDSYYEFTGVESGKDYSIRIWEEAVNNTLANTWSWNNWGGATSADAFIISWMANMDPQLTAFPWIWPAGATALTPYSLKLADVNNNQMIANSDALMVMYRLLGEAGYSPFPGGAHNFTLATTKLDDHMAKSHPVAPEKIFNQYGNYSAAAAAPTVYQEVLLANVSDGTNIYNIYFVATGDLNTSYAPGAGNKQLAVLEYNNIIRSSKGDEILIPVRISEAADLGAITLGFSYNTNVIEVLDVIGYDLFAIDNVNGTVKIAWYDHQGKSFGENQHIVVLKAKLINEITAGTRHLELLPMTEFADGSANVLSNVTLKTDFIESAAGIITNPELLVISHSVYPNPFNGTATLRYTLPEAGKLTLTIFNHLGQEVTSHVEENQAAGAHELKLTSSLFNQAGNYHYRLQLTNQNGTHQARGSVVFTK